VQILVTGARGRIGTAVVQRLVDAGHGVVSADLTEVTGATADERVVDLRDISAVRSAVEGVDAVVHAGAIPGNRPGMAPEVDHINVLGTMNVLRAMSEHGVDLGVLFSSINAIGIVGGHDVPDRLPFTDDHPQRPRTGYQLGKQLGEFTAAAFAREFGMRLTSLRPTFVSTPEWYRRIVAEPLPEAWLTRELGGYVDREDIVDAVVAGLGVTTAGHNAVLLSAPDTVFTRPTADLVREQLPHVPWIGTTLDEWVADEPRRALIDSSGAEAILGVRPHRRWQELASAGADH
jgi:nucleoside-diphosphate-sugar epimerase